MTDISISGGGEFAEFADELRAAAADVDEVVDRAVKETALEVERSAKQNAPVDTGTLRSSIETAPSGVGEYLVGTNIEYAPDVEFGTDPHVITPDEADALAFEGSDGELVVTQRVKHPGTPAQPFLRPAIDEHESTLTRNIAAAITELLDDI